MARSSFFRSPARASALDIDDVARLLRDADRRPPGDPRRGRAQRLVAGALIEQPELIRHPRLAARRHELSSWARWAPFLLDDDTERETASTTRREIDRELLRLDRVAHDDVASVRTIEELLALLEDPDPAVRAAADRSAGDRCAARSADMAQVLHRLTSLHAEDDARRGILDWRLRGAIAQGTSIERLDRLTMAVRDARPLAQRWYRSRATLVGAAYSDRRVGFGGGRHSLDDDVAEVVAAFSVVAPLLGPTASRLSRSVVAGSMNEMSMTPTGSISISVDHRGTARSRLMVAHELGHAVHASVATAAGASEPPLATAAETLASWVAIVCGRRWVDSPQGAAWALALGDHLVDELFLSAAVFAVEDRMHRWVRSGHVLTADDADTFWREELQDLYGDVIEVPAWAASGWARLETIAVEPGVPLQYVWATVLALAALDAPRTTDVFALGALDSDELPAAFGLDGDDWVDAGLDCLATLLGQLITTIAGD